MSICPGRRHVSRAPVTALLVAGALLAGCDVSGGYEIVERPATLLASDAPGPADTLPAVTRLRGEPPYPCARLLPGVEARWRGDTLLVVQREDVVRRTDAFCVPYNAAARTTGIERAARVYPAEPHGELPGYAGWRLAAGD